MDIQMMVNAGINLNIDVVCCKLYFIVVLQYI